MTYELLIQHQGAVMLPPVVESVSIEWERQGQPGKLTADIVKTPGLSFQEGDPCRFSVDGTPIFYGFVFEKARKGSMDQVITITVYDQLYYLKNKDTYVYSNKTAAAVIRMIAEDFQLNVGALADTGYTIASRVEDSKTLFDIIQTALDETLKATSQMYVLYDDVGKLTLKNIGDIAPSPFDYQRNCLLYLPQIPPSQADSDYYDDLAEQIVKLLDAANGHALGLFTSYAAMSAVRERLKQRDLPYPVLTLGRNGGHTLSEFMAHPGSVLLAAGAAWEGFDFPGDCVSLLILPRLPFPMPDAVKEQERMKHATLHDFLRAVVVPEMQIKLRQGFGRAIRTETDTCVVAILDERAGKDRRYFRDVLTALPEVPVTHSLKDVERFIRAVKPEGYFLEGAA